MVRAGLERGGYVLDALTPFEREELVRLVVHRVEVADRQIALEGLPRYRPRPGDVPGPFTL
jgi:hypothetical protein